MSTDGAPLNNNNDDVPKTIGSAPNSLPGSPINRVKFMCSHGGKILPRPADGQLKYVGGETRVISVPTDISFQELMKKLTFMIDGEMILKYQIVTEDLDSLISVKTDEDVHHMFDEIDRYENAGIPRLRVFLFPKNTENQTAPDPAHTTEQQRYIDAINGILRCHTSPAQRQQQQQTGPLVIASSPSSPNSSTVDGINTETRNNMHRVLSSPSIYNLSNSNNNTNNLHASSLLQHQQQNASYHHHLPHQHQHLLHPNQYHHYAGGLGFQSPQPDRLTSVRSVGRAEGVRYQVDPASQYYYTVSKRVGNNNGCCSKYCTSSSVVHQDEATGHGYGNDLLRKISIERTGSVSISPVLPSSPRFGQSGMRMWDYGNGDI